MGKGLTTLDILAAEARHCTHCAALLPLGAHPVFQVSTTARLIIIGQASGTKVHNTGVPFNDASGDRLRGWMGMSRDAFYDASKIAIMPMGFCYPGRLPQGGDCPPRPECAPLWHERFLALMPQLELVLLVGGYAQNRYLGKGSMTAHVQAGRRGRYLPLPHPSWRTTGWEKKNPWFGEEVLPRLRTEVKRLTE